MENAPEGNNQASVAEQAEQWTQLGEADGGAQTGDHTNKWDGLKNVEYRGKTVQEVKDLASAADKAYALAPAADKAYALAPDAEARQEKLGKLYEASRQVERQVYDMEVLLAFCPLEEAENIIHSKDYGTILEKSDLDLADLFNADVLFSEQYYHDGFSRDYDWRHSARGSRLESAKDYGLVQHGTFYDYEPTTARVNDAKEALSILASYYGEDGDQEAAKMMKSCITNKAWGNENKAFSDEQVEFLKGENNILADRLLYGPGVYNEERAKNTLSRLEHAAEYYQEDVESNDDYDREHADTDLLERMLYAEKTIDDYENAGKPELIREAKEKLHDLIMEYIDIAAGDYPDWSNELEHRREDLIINYESPYRLVETVAKYDLVQKRIIDNPDRIVDRLAYFYRDDATRAISWRAKDLKEIGVSDEAIMEHCSDLQAYDFIDKETVDGSGTRLLEAGVDKSLILKNIYNSTSPWRINRNPFAERDYPLHKDRDAESQVDMLKRNGFNMTDIAQTYSPDDISNYIDAFLDGGAKPKELMEYMMSYSERFDANISVDDNSGEERDSLLGHEGVQDIRIYDKNHEGYRLVRKEIMAGEGAEYVALNIDAFADHGISEEQVMSALPGRYSNPKSDVFQRILECEKFDRPKLLSLGREKYTEYARRAFGDEFADFASSPDRYYADVFDGMSGSAKEQRDRYFKELRRHW